MVITQLVEATKSRIRVFIDDEFAFVLYKGELHKYGVKVGNELVNESYHEIMTQILPKRAKLRCMNLLKSKDYTREQLRMKLSTGGYPDSITEEALDYVASYKYIDDVRYAGDYIRCSQDIRSRRKIEMDLRKRGISSDTIEKAWNSWYEEGNTLNEDEQIQRWIEKKHFCKETADQSEIRRMYGFLCRKGFDSDKISKAIF